MTELDMAQGLRALVTGFLLGLSLILAIGPQNAFVLRQGLLSQHVLPVVLFCALSDALLITLGIAGVSLAIKEFAEQYQHTLFLLAAGWLSVYGVQRLRDAWRGDATLQLASGERGSLRNTLGVAALLTFGNPHVYLDTVVLIGTLSLQYSGLAKVAFGAGAVLASLVFFSALAFAARLMLPLMRKRHAWRVIDGVIAGIMFVLAVGMLFAGEWL
ncbi:LysE/ArgO family amino acid transporter [Luminiphilus sp.]|nr:LysE/ArgO family amino acid transporter [Luminiphilus sp.]